MKYIFWILMVSIAHASTNTDEIFPAGCKPLEVKSELVSLSAIKPTIVMIHNVSKFDLWITHPLSEPNASAGWSSHLQIGNWSALALDKKAFDLSCIESRPGHEQQVHCSGLLSICQWPEAKTEKKEAGTFWVGEDMVLSALMAHIGSRGFVLPAAA